MRETPPPIFFQTRYTPPPLAFQARGDPPPYPPAGPYPAMQVPLITRRKNREIDYYGRMPPPPLRGGLPHTPPCAYREDLPDQRSFRHFFANVK